MSLYKEALVKIWRKPCGYRRQELDRPTYIQDKTHSKKQDGDEMDSSGDTQPRAQGAIAMLKYMESRCVDWVLQIKLDIRAVGQ